MTALTELCLTHNRLTALPEAIGQLTGLETLRLDNNQLTALPDSIVGLTNLTYLRLDNNRDFIRSEQSAAVRGWLQGLEDSPTCIFNM
jgi:Leucine-rich repeat (LRR) protein